MHPDFLRALKEYAIRGVLPPCSERKKKDGMAAYEALILNIVRSVEQARREAGHEAFVFADGAGI
jgi:hypothetical protein